MASIRNLKKDVNYVFGEIIESVYIWQLTNPEKDTATSEEIIDEAIVAFDETIAAINAQNVDNKKVHFSEVKKAISDKATALVERINKL